jgi:hypothetical protein
MKQMLLYELKEEATPKAIETFTIGINGLDTNFAYLEIYWENSRVALKFEVPTQKKGNGKHRKCMAGASAGDYLQQRSSIINLMAISIKRERTLIKR